MLVLTQKGCAEEVETRRLYDLNDGYYELKNRLKQRLLPQRRQSRVLLNGAGDGGSCEHFEASKRSSIYHQSCQETLIPLSNALRFYTLKTKSNIQP